MDLLYKEDIMFLLKQRGQGPCISLYMPTDKGREGAKANSIRYKNLLNKAEDEMKKAGKDYREINELLEPANKLIDDSFFWANQSEGFAYFISPGYTRYYRLPVQFDELSVTREVFHIKPLLSLISTDGQFYVLAISQQDARLLRGTNYRAEEIDLSDLLEKFEEKFATELPDQHLQFHTRAPAEGGVRSAIYFGHGGEIDSIQKERMLKYFRFIDHEIKDKVGEYNTPLILACVDHLFSVYREASKYPLLFEEGIKGNPENMSIQELHSKALEIVKPYFQKRQEEIKGLYYELTGTGKTSDRIMEIVPASFHGRVSDLFVPLGVQQWGNYNPENDQVELSDRPGTGSEDLVDLAAAETILNNGNVYAVEREQMPSNGIAAAVFRW